MNTGEGKQGLTWRDRVKNEEIVTVKMEPVCTAKETNMHDRAE